MKNSKKIIIILLLLTLFISGCGSNSNNKSENKKEEYLTIDTKYNKIDRFFNDLFKEQKIEKKDYELIDTYEKDDTHSVAFENDDITIYGFFNTDDKFNYIAIKYNTNSKKIIKYIETILNYSFFDFSKKDINDIKELILAEDDDIKFINDFIVYNSEKTLVISDRDYFIEISSIPANNKNEDQEQNNDNSTGNVNPVNPAGNTQSNTNNNQNTNTSTNTNNNQNTNTNTNTNNNQNSQQNSSGITVSQQNALNSANSYLRFMAFSYNGLIEQLEYEGYTHEDAIFAVDHCGANWNQQALKSAQSYLRTSAFSYNGLVEQLEYEQFTHDQSIYAVNNCGADWNEQAVKSAASYLKYMSFSRDGLIDQLQYEGFTYDQAVYGVTQNGL